MEGDKQSVKIRQCPYRYAGEYGRRSAQPGQHSAGKIPAPPEYSPGRSRQQRRSSGDPPQPSGQADQATAVCHMSRLMGLETDKPPAFRV